VVWFAVQIPDHRTHGGPPELDSYCGVNSFAKEHSTDGPCVGEESDAVIVRDRKGAFRRGMVVHQFQTFYQC
jgi:hypothetical protein